MSENKTISLSKGTSISLAKEAPNVKRFLIGASWKERTTAGDEFDLDLMAVLLNEEGKVRTAKDCIFYNLAPKPGAPFTSVSGSWHHNGDNLVGGAAEGISDSEQLIFDTEKEDAAIHRIPVLIAIFDAEARRQNFGGVRDVTMRIADADNPNVNLFTIDLTEDFGAETIVIGAEFYRHNGEWKVKNISQGYEGGLVAALEDFGLNVQ